MTEAAPPSLLRKVLRAASIVALLLIVAVLGLLLARPEALLFHPTSGLTRTPEAIAVDYERVEITTADGEILERRPVWSHDARHIWGAPCRCRSALVVCPIRPRRT